jgi:alkanesulfonate monooxygenase SsuD/methylene tetrahydromethanopterin reductase-like flavin-dependent oxidoreductase (luciferase family)
LHGGWVSTLKIGTGLPYGDPDAPSIPQAAREIEASGLESAWLPDLIIGDGTPAVEAALALAAAAAVTERIGLGFSVLVVPLRPAPWLATQIGTLQHLSGNRVLLGVGSGGFPTAPFWRALGVAAADRGRLTDDTLAALPALLAGETVGPLTLAPAPMPPVLVGGSERAFRRVLAHGDGWFPSLISPADLAPRVARLREQAAGRTTPSVTVGGHLILGTDAVATAAYDALVRNLVDVHGMPPEVAARTPVTASSPAELADAFAAYERAGADRVVFGADNLGWRAQLEFIAEAAALLQ